jgi:hypothetical protein
MNTRSSLRIRMLRAAALASSILASAVIAQTVHAGADTDSSRAKPPVVTTASSSNVLSAEGWRIRNATFYKRNWGVDIVGVRLVSSGHMIEFRYRVLDAAKAAPVNDKKATPYLTDEKTGARLTVPVMEKIGQLRQTAAPKNDQMYWMVFANEGKIVESGNKVDLAIGKFRVNGLVVE